MSMLEPKSVPCIKPSNKQPPPDKRSTKRKSSDSYLTANKRSIEYSITGKKIHTFYEYDATLTFSPETTSPTDESEQTEKKEAIDNKFKNGFHDGQIFVFDKNRGNNTDHNDAENDEEKARQYVDKCEFPVKINTELTWMTITIQSNDVGFPISNGTTFDLKGSKIEILIRTPTHEFALYVDGILSFSSGYQYTVQEKYMDRKKKLLKKKKYNLITFRYEESMKTARERLPEHGEVCFKDGSDVLYFSNLMHDVLSDGQIDPTLLSKRVELYQFLENNKNNGTVVLKSYALPFVKFIDHLQGIERDSKACRMDDIMYLKVSLYAHRYGCLDLINIDKTRINNFLDNSTIKTYKAIREVCSNILETKTISNIGVMLNDMFNLERTLVSMVL